MTTLGEFLEPIEVAGRSLGEKYQAYRMDGTSPQPDMRRKADLGTCNCCDYFIFNKDNTIALIEETKLMKQIRGLKDEYDYLEVNDQTEFISKYIRDENKLKVYGSMLVLCRLADVCKNVNDIHQTKKYKFWLVASGMETEEDARLFDHLKDRLLNDLQSVLTGKILDGVEIIPSSVFTSKLSEYATIS